MLTLVTAPESYPTDLDAIKAHLRIDEDTDDTLLTAYIEAATSYCEVQTGRAYVSQTWDLMLSSFSNPIWIPKPPLQSVTYVKYYDSDNEQQTWGSENYHVVTGTKAQGRLEPVNGVSYPATYSRPDAITIRFVAGYSSMPAQVVHAVKLLCGHFYENRENEQYHHSRPISLGADRLLDQLRAGEYI